MSKFHYDNAVKNNIIKLDTDDVKFSQTLSSFAEYIIREHKKNKIPLIVVGAGASASKVKFLKEEDGKLVVSENEVGLPTMNWMIEKIAKLLIDINEPDEDIKKLKELFHLEGYYVNGDYFEKLFNNIDREWLSKVFSTLSNSEHEKTKKIWEDFHMWFLFDCIERDGEDSLGALTTATSLAAQEIGKICQEYSALCFSANFDNYVSHYMRKEHNKRCISLFSKKYAKKYFIRTRRKTNGKKFNEENLNPCIIHANGDVFWLSCRGNEIDGYCPKTGKYLPAFNREKYKKREQLKCDLCGSDLKAIMTMPGTYKKDHDTREMISTIWKYAASKISCVITVGLSCNWDDVILKFILELLLENDIPHLDINNQSDGPKESSVIRKIVENSFFESISLKEDAFKGVNLLYEKIKEADDNNKKPEVLFVDSTKEHIKRLLQEEKGIKRLENVSQIALKAYWNEIVIKNETLTRDEIVTKNDRWNHSISVADKALRMYEILHANSNKEESQFERALIYFSGLLHDCGHLPFSHMLEDVFSELSWKYGEEITTFSHNHHTAYLIKQIFSENQELKRIVDDYGVSVEEIADVINGKYGVGYIDALINSEIDADKIAYIFKDANQTLKNLTIKSGEFFEKLLSEAYITQEGLIAYDSESAWVGLKLLDERKRMYDELYFNTRIRCLESAVKFILITYFVQKYNCANMEAYEKYDDHNYSDLSHCRIMMVIEDLFEMTDSEGEQMEYVIHYSISPVIKKALKKCMDIAVGDHENNENKEIPSEKKILETIYFRLTNEKYMHSGTRTLFYTPYIDNDINELYQQLSYEKLYSVKKKISINFPGTLLIDLYKPTKYLSPAKSRQKKQRLDGTFESKTTILVPDNNKDEWIDKKSLAEIDISDYVSKWHNDDEKIVFDVFKIDDDQTACEHAINMLKKELKRLVER